MFVGCCSDGWVENAGVCYKFITNNASSSQADEVCRNLGAQLLTIDSSRKSAFINGHISTTTGELSLHPSSMEQRFPETLHFLTLLTIMVEPLWLCYK